MTDKSLPRAKTRRTSISSVDKKVTEIAKSLKDDLEGLDKKLDLFITSACNTDDKDRLEVMERFDQLDSAISARPTKKTMFLAALCGVFFAFAALWSAKYIATYIVDPHTLLSRYISDTAAKGGAFDHFTGAN